ncbi:hypothetical protein, partial [Aminivibrio sp.]|uniref:hypothetical protein n=1 Tax=Aminivibrio sp. TaxID=1872489 RepID=UPI003D97074D
MGHIFLSSSIRFRHFSKALTHTDEASVLVSPASHSRTHQRKAVPRTRTALLPADHGSRNEPHVKKLPA